MSSDYFKLFLPEIGRDRRAVAIDTPGYGESDPPPEPQPIEALAAAMADALEALGLGSGGAGQVDVLGVHTGSLIAGELAVQRPDLVRRVILSGVPLFLGEERIRHPRPALHQGSEDRMQRSPHAHPQPPGAVLREIAEEHPGLRGVCSARLGPWHCRHRATAREEECQFRE
jgi:pimeloyl-ACP methyl ester carboxylesterase